MPGWTSDTLDPITGDKPITGWWGEYNIDSFPPVAGMKIGALPPTVSIKADVDVEFAHPAGIEVGALPMTVHIDAAVELPVGGGFEVGAFPPETVTGLQVSPPTAGIEIGTEVGSFTSSTEVSVQLPPPPGMGIGATAPTAEVTESVPVEIQPNAARMEIGALAPVVFAGHAESSAPPTAGVEIAAGGLSVSVAVNFNAPAANGVKLGSRGPTVTAGKSASASPTTNGLKLGAFAPTVTAEVYHPPEIVEVTATGLYYAPAWWRNGIDYCDMIGLGAGGAGKGDVFGAWGYGGNAGQYAVATAQTLVSNRVYVALGTGGTGQAGGGAPRAGTATTIRSGSSGGTLFVTAPGGTGNNNNGSGSALYGKSPGNRSYQGMTMVGGAQVGGNGTDGNPPGGGGAGSGSYTTAGDGARGGAKIQWRMAT